MNRLNIFKLEDGIIVIDKVELRADPEFRPILERLLKIPGDHDGKKKFGNFKLLHYIKLVADMFSWINQSGYNDKEIHAQAVKESGLDDKYKPDAGIIAAINKYRKIQEDMYPSLGTLTVALRGLRTTRKILDRMTSNMESKLELLDKKKAEAEARGETMNIADEQIIIDQLIKQIEDLNKMSITIPKTLDALEKIEDRLKRESAGDTVARGGKSIGNRADPKS